MTEKPSLRESQRYLKLKIHADDEVGFEDLLDSVWDALLGYMGEKDSSRANPWLIKNKFDSKDETAVLKVRRGSQEDVRAALTLQDSLSGIEGFIEVKRQSGTLKGLEE